MYFNERECKRAMLDAGIENWTELSTRSGVTREQLYNIRKGKCAPSIATCYALMEALGIDRYRFFKLFPPEQKPNKR